tara:strand:+ start:276 stop:422 length:147 start_codon:yes stop_codon:yes gene_type:complete
MPKVGNKHFSYSSKGKKAAQAYAKRTGKAVRMSKTSGKSKKGGRRSGY